MGFGAVFAVVGIGGVLVRDGVGVLRLATLENSQLDPAAVPLVLLGLLGVLVLSVGVVAYVIVGSSSRKRAEQGYGSIGTILACLGAAIIVSNVLALPYALVVAQLHPGVPTPLSPGTIVLSVVLLDGALLGVVYVRIVRPGVLSWEQLGLRTNNLGHLLRIGVGTGVLTIVASGLVELLLQGFGVHQTQYQEFEGLLGAPPPQIVGVFLAVAIVAPACEEIFFRGYVFTALRQTRGLWPGIGASSVLFALAHLNVQAFLPILLIGIIFAIVCWRTGSLVPTMVAHAMNNAVAMAGLFLGSR
jgi:membrane protease YdiL (CAAX protease family)